MQGWRGRVATSQGRVALRHSVLVVVERLLTTGGRQALNCSSPAYQESQPQPADSWLLEWRGVWSVEVGGGERSNCWPHGWRALTTLSLQSIHSILALFCCHLYCSTSSGSICASCPNVVFGMNFNIHFVNVIYSQSLSHSFDSRSFHPHRTLHSPSLHFTLFFSTLKLELFHKSFEPQTPANFWTTFHRLLNCFLSFHAHRLVSSFISSLYFSLIPFGRSWISVSFPAHVRHKYVVSCRIKYMNADEVSR